jgi:hypothetical protein
VKTGRPFLFLGEKMPEILTPPKLSKIDTTLNATNATSVPENPWAFDCTLITAGPGNPASKYYYPPEWINDPLTAKLYNGAQCYVDHDGVIDMENRPERSTRDLLGYWSMVRAENNALKGRLNIIPAQENERFRDLIALSITYRSEFPDKNLCGFSVVQQGKFELFDFQGEQWKRVTKTNTVVSVDLVTLPARGGQADAPVTGKENESSRVRAEQNALESLREMVGTMRESGQSMTAFAKYYIGPKVKETEAEVESTDAGPLPALIALRDKVAAAPDDQPMKHDLRRGLDQAISAYQKQNESEGKAMPKPVDDGTTTQHIKTKPGMTVAIQHSPDGGGGTGVPTAQPDDGNDQDEEEAARCEEAAAHFTKMAESEQEAEAKGKFTKMAEAFKKQAESKRSKMAEAKKQREAEEESKRKAQAEAESKGKTKEEEEEAEQESLREMATDQLMREAEFPTNVAQFVRNRLAGKPLAARKQIIEDAKNTLMRESVGPISPARQVRTSSSSISKTELDAVLKGC